MPTEADQVPQPAIPDYPIEDTVEATSPSQLKALGDDTRRQILTLLLERAATTSHLAEALNKPKGTVGYHVKVLEGVGLVRVVRRRQVRAITEKYYGRVGRTILIKPRSSGAEYSMLQEALREARVPDPDAMLPMFTLRHVRLTEADAAVFAQRLVDLAEEFAAAPRSGEVVYGLIAGVYPTDHAIFHSEDRA